MAQKNEKRREDILRISYQLFGSMSYDKVSLGNIAKGSGINKSLLQHYYPQKVDIIKMMLEELLRVSFSYMDVLPYQDKEIFQRVSDFNMLFFKSLERDHNLRQFIITSVSQDECMDAWNDTICSWLHRYCGEKTFSYLQLKTAICFSMSGAMHLFMHQDELGIDYQMFCRKHIETILGFLEYKEEDILKICAQTDKRIEHVDVEQYLKYCEDRISWLLL